MIALVLACAVGCDEAPAPPTTATPPPAPPAPPPAPPPLDPAVASALGAALARVATGTTSIDYGHQWVGMTGGGGFELHLERHPAQREGEPAQLEGEPAQLEGHIACSILGQRRDVEVAFASADVDTRLAALARAAVTSDGSAGGTPEGSDDQRVTLHAEGGDVVLTSRSFLGEDWQITAGGAVAFTRSPEVHALVDAIATAAFTDRCDRHAPDQSPPAPARFGVPEVPSLAPRRGL